MMMKNGNGYRKFAKTFHLYEITKTCIVIPKILSTKLYSWYFSTDLSYILFFLRYKLNKRYCERNRLKAIKLYVHINQLRFRIVKKFS